MLPKRVGYLHSNNALASNMLPGERVSAPLNSTDPDPATTAIKHTAEILGFVFFSPLFFCLFTVTTKPMHAN